MDDMQERIEGLDNDDALKALAYLAELIAQQPGQELSAELQSKLTDQDARVLLAAAFPELAGELGTTAGEDQARSEQANSARRLLSVLAQDGQYAPKVLEALDQGPFVFEPFLTGLLVAAGIAFVLSIQFKVESVIVDGKRQTSVTIKRKATSEDLIGKILNPPKSFIDALFHESGNEKKDGDNGDDKEG